MELILKTVGCFVPLFLGNTSYCPFAMKFRVGSLIFGQFVDFMARWKAENQKISWAFGRVQILVLDGVIRDCRLNYERREYQIV